MKFRNSVSVKRMSNEKVCEQRLRWSGWWKDIAAAICVVAYLYVFHGWYADAFAVICLLMIGWTHFEINIDWSREEKPEPGND